MIGFVISFAAAKKEMAWVPTIPNLPEGGEDARALYGEGYKTYIVRGLSLVPDVTYLW